MMSHGLTGLTRTNTTSSVLLGQSKFNALNDILFSGPDGLLSPKLAESLEPIIDSSVRKWYDTRFGLATNFLDANNNARPETTAVRDWVSHVLLNRSMNIAASTTSSPQVQQKMDIKGVPATLFFNSHAFQRFLPDADPSKEYQIVNQVYVEDVNALEFGLYYPVPNTREPRLAVARSEGPFSFLIIEPGIEDYQGMKTNICLSNS